jgi:hypothetical protein
LDSAHEDLSRIRSPALIHAHPGHELYVFGWVKLARPRIFVLTDGSGRTSRGRAQSTANLIDSVGAKKGEIFCPLTDQAIYDAILTGNISLFETLLETIASALIAHDIDFVAGDAVEGFNPSHDICRFLIDGAVALVKRRTGQVIPNYEISLTTWEHGKPERHDSECRHLILSDVSLEQKLRSAFAYEELREEVLEHTRANATEHFRTECFRKVRTELSARISDTPYYERVGQERVRDGIYRTPLRYREHVLPIFDAVCNYAAM